MGDPDVDPFDRLRDGAYRSRLTAYCSHPRPFATSAVEDRVVYRWDTAGCFDRGLQLSTVAAEVPVTDPQERFPTQPMGRS